MGLFDKIGQIITRNSSDATPTLSICMMGPRSLGKSRYPKIVSTNSKTKYKLWQQALQLKQ